MSLRQYPLFPTPVGWRRDFLIIVRQRSVMTIRRVDEGRRGEVLGRVAESELARVMMVGGLPMMGMGGEKDAALNGGKSQRRGRSR
jgi:hypothetical protein